MNYDIILFFLFLHNFRDLEIINNNNINDNMLLLFTQKFVILLLCWFGLSFVV